MGFPGGSDGKESACRAGDTGLIPGSGRSPEKGVATHSSILACRISWTEEAGGLYSPWGHKEWDMTELLILSGKESFTALPNKGGTEQLPILKTATIQEDLVSFIAMVQGWSC